MPKSKSCLIIGPYGVSGSEERVWSDWLVQAIIKPVVEHMDFGYRASRTIDDPQPGAITRRIMSSIRDADLVVADLTWSNPNVYYELALRHATGKPFIHLARQGTQIPFDIKVMNVVEVAKGKEDEAHEQLRLQLESVKNCDVNFETDACEPTPRFQAKAYEWEISYSNNLAEKWLDKQDDETREAVKQYNSKGGVPTSDPLKNALLEYLAYRLAQGVIIPVDLYYILDVQQYHFDGVGIIPEMSGRDKLPVKVSGDEYRNSGNIELRFDQPRAHQRIGTLEGDLGPFQYIVRLRASERRGYFEGEFTHPRYPEIRVGRCTLRPKAG